MHAKTFPSFVLEPYFKAFTAEGMGLSMEGWRVPRGNSCRANLLDQLPDGIASEFQYPKSNTSR